MFSFHVKMGANDSADSKTQPESNTASTIMTTQNNITKDTLPFSQMQTLQIEPSASEKEISQQVCNFYNDQPLMRAESTSLSDFEHTGGSTTVPNNQHFRDTLQL